eukprot:7390688-Prymnesium_polylepis.2
MGSSLAAALGAAAPVHVTRTSLVDTTEDETTVTGTARLAVLSWQGIDTCNAVLLDRMSGRSEVCFCDRRGARAGAVGVSSEHNGSW